jgi:hypothetical protein
MPDQVTAKQATQDPGLEFSEYLDKLHERIVDRAKKEHIVGILRLGNVWRLNNVEATITQGGSPTDLLMTFRRGTDGTRTTESKVGSLESTAEAIVEKFEKLTR